MSQSLKALKGDAPVEIERLIEVMHYPDPTHQTEQLHTTLYKFIEKFCEYDPVFASLSLPDPPNLGYRRPVYELFQLVKRTHSPEVD